MTTDNNDNKDNHNHNQGQQQHSRRYSVSEAKKLESGSSITVTGMIASYSTSYKTISKSEYECANLSCNNQGSESYKPPLLVPLEKFDNTRGFNIKCFKCGSTTFTVNHTYHNTRSIQLEDSDKTATDESNSTDRLEVVLYNNAASNVVAGEVVDITGDMYIQRKSDNGSNGSGGKSSKKLVNVLHSSKISYRNKEKIVITPKDIEIFYKHKEICDTAYRRELEITTGTRRAEPWVKKIVPMKYIDRLVAMFAPNVIGHNDAKLGLLRSMVGGRVDHGDDNGRRGRLNTLLVGDPGTAKSILARESTKLIPNSRYLNAQNTSGKSLIGIVDKESDGGLFLRLGPAVLAKGAICAINEIGFMSPEDQGHITDIAEEGRTTLVKYSTSFELDAPTTIIATANPYNAGWNSVSNISKDEIPILRTLIDRNDQLYAFRDVPSEPELRDYTRQKTKIRNRRPHNYNFLRKLLMYVRTVNPKMTNKDDGGSAVEYRLNEFWTNARLEGATTNRAYDSIFRIAEAQAKLNLSMEIDDDIATQTMDSMRLMLLQYGKIVQTIKSPRDIAYNAFLNILKQNKAPLSIEELCRIASDENKQVSKYLGDSFKMQGNKKVRTLVDMLLNHSCIKQIQQHPMVIQWIDGGNDLHDPKRDVIDDNGNIESQIRSSRSSRSPTSQEEEATESDKPFKCYYCKNTSFQDDLERIKHIDIEHPGRLHHPTQEDFENRLER